MRRPWAVVCDFDRTATTEDIGVQISIRFAGRAHWDESEELYRQGAYPFSGLLSRMFEPITATPGAGGPAAGVRAVRRCLPRGRPALRALLVGPRRLHRADPGAPPDRAARARELEVQPGGLLAVSCKSRGIPHRIFESFDEVITSFPE